jgi:hypothetical protein
MLSTDILAETLISRSGAYTSHTQIKPIINPEPNAHTHVHTSNTVYSSGSSHIVYSIDRIVEESCTQYICNTTQRGLL